MGSVAGVLTLRGGDIRQLPGRAVTVAAFLLARAVSTPGSSPATLARRLPSAGAGIGSEDIRTLVARLDERSRHMVSTPMLAIQMKEGLSMPPRQIRPLRLDRATCVCLVSLGLILSSGGASSKGPVSTSSKSPQPVRLVGLNDPILRQAPDRVVEVFIKDSNDWRATEVRGRDHGFATCPRVHLFSKQEALKILTAEVASNWLRKQLEGVHRSFLPASFLIVTTYSTSAKAVAQTLKRNSLVDPNEPPRPACAWM